jgi:hypothetical protein
MNLPGVDPELKKTLMFDTKMDKILSVAATKDATNLNQYRPMGVSATGYLLAGLNPVAVVRNKIGTAVMRGVTKASNDFRANINGNIADVLHVSPEGASPLREGMVKAAPYLPGMQGGLSAPNLLAGGLSRLGNMGTNTATPGMDTAAQQPPPSGGGMASQSASALTPAQMANMKAGYEPSPMDDAILRNASALFDQQYRGFYDSDPAQGAEVKQHFIDTVLQRIHTQPGANGRNGRAIDPEVASKILFANDPAKQALFTKAARQDMVIRDALGGKGPENYAGVPLVGDFAKFANPQGAQKYSQIKQMIESEAGKESADQFDRIMYNPGVKDKRSAIIQLLTGNPENAKAWSYYNQALGGVR